MLYLIRISHGKVRTPLGRLDHGLEHMQVGRGQCTRKLLSIYSGLLPPFFPLINSILINKHFYNFQEH